MMPNTGCSDLILDSPGCMAIARLMLEILDNSGKTADRRLFEAGKCEICRKNIKFAWSLVNKKTFKEFDYETGSIEAGKCDRGEYDAAKFQATPIYYCSHVLDNWATLEDAEEFQLMTTYQGKHGPLIKRFLDTRNKVSPVDVAYALQDKREFDAKQAFAPSKGKRKAPMDMI